MLIGAYRLPRIVHQPQIPPHFAIFQIQRFARGCICREEVAIESHVRQLQ